MNDDERPTKCEGCGHEFVGDEWEEAHDHQDSFYYHEECCPYCNPPKQENEPGPEPDYELMHAILRVVLRDLVEYAVGNRGSRTGNPYLVPEIIEALRVLGEPEQVCVA
jgi:hypothetical protein